MRTLLRIFYLEHKTNDWVRSKINLLVDPQKPLLATVERQETCMVRACHTPRQPLQNHPLGHLGGWATPWSAEEMLDEQLQIVSHARTAHKGLKQKRLKEDICSIVPHVLKTTQWVKRLY